MRGFSINAFHEKLIMPLKCKKYDIDTKDTNFCGIKYLIFFIINRSVRFIYFNMQEYTLACIYNDTRYQTLYYPDSIEFTIDNARGVLGFNFDTYLYVFNRTY